MNGQLEIHGPERCGILNQFKVVTWRYLSSRFGLLGQATQFSLDLPENWIMDKTRRVGDKIHRRFEGKNGWLWKTIYDQQEKIRDIEYQHLVDYIRIPSWLKWIRSKI